MARFKPGDHIKMPSMVVIKHHAIVTEVNHANGNLRVVHFAGKDGIKEEWVDFGSKATLVQSPPSSEVEAVIKRARSRIGETNYDFLYNNCEHFANWCMTKVKRSWQAVRAKAVQVGVCVVSCPLAVVAAPVGAVVAAGAVTGVTIGSLVTGHSLSGLFGAVVGSAGVASSGSCSSSSSNSSSSSCSGCSGSCSGSCSKCS